MKMNILKKTVAACSVAAFMAVGCVSVAQAATRMQFGVSDPSSAVNPSSRLGAVNTTTQMIAAGTENIKWACIPDTKVIPDKCKLADGKIPTTCTSDVLKSWLTNSDHDVYIGGSGSVVDGGVSVQTAEFQCFTKETVKVAGVDQTVYESQTPSTKALYYLVAYAGTEASPTKLLALADPSIKSDQWPQVEVGCGAMDPKGAITWGEFQNKIDAINSGPLGVVPTTGITSNCVTHTSVSL